MTASKENETISGFTSSRGEHIFFRNWKATVTRKGVILIVHGLNSHSAYYRHFASQLNENGYEAYAIDLRGRGHSAGERYYISDYKEIIADIGLLLGIIASSHPAVPIFLLGHSAGGVFASVYALLHQAKLKGLISESFAFDLPVPGFALAIVKFLGQIIPHTRLIKLKNEDFSRERELVEKMNNDPLLENEKQPAKTMQQLLLASEYLKKGMPELKLPLLILHGTADKATRPEGSKYFIEHTSSADKQLKLYEGYYHDLLNDKYNGIVIKDILEWLDARAL